MRPKMHVILEQAIEEGVKRGYRRAFKYNENPAEDYIHDEISNCVMSAITEYFTFEDHDFF